jgi:hypothetical protein
MCSSLSKRPFTYKGRGILDFLIMRYKNIVKQDMIIIIMIDANFVLCEIEIKDLAF